MLGLAGDPSGADAGSDSALLRLALLLGFAGRAAPRLVILRGFGDTSSSFLIVGISPFEASVFAFLWLRRGAARVDALAAMFLLTIGTVLKRIRGLKGIPSTIIRCYD